MHSLVGASMCPDQESNLQSSCIREMLQPTEPPIQGGNSSLGASGAPAPWPSTVGSTTGSTGCLARRRTGCPAMPQPPQSLTGLLLRGPSTVGILGQGLGSRGGSGESTRARLLLQPFSPNDSLCCHLLARTASVLLHPHQGLELPNSLSLVWAASSSQGYTLSCAGKSCPLKMVGAHYLESGATCQPRPWGSGQARGVGGWGEQEWSRS